MYVPISEADQIQPWATIVLSLYVSVFIQILFALHRSAQLRVLHREVQYRRPHSFSHSDWP